MHVAVRDRLLHWQGLFAQGNYGGYVPPGGSLNPYAANPYGQPPPKKSKALLYILLGFGGAMLVVCGLCAGGGYFAFGTGMSMVASQPQAEIQGKPAVQEHIGTIETATADLMAGVDEGQKKGARPGDNYLVIHIKGSKGSGDVVGRLPQGAQRLSSKILR